jgi:hypothetical protein
MYCGKVLFFKLKNTNVIKLVLNSTQASPSSVVYNEFSLSLRTNQHHHQNRVCNSNQIQCSELLRHIGTHSLCSHKWCTQTPKAPFTLLALVICNGTASELYCGSPTVFPKKICNGTASELQSSLMFKSSTYSNYIYDTEVLEKWHTGILIIVKNLELH